METSHTHENGSVIRLKHVSDPVSRPPLPPPPPIMHAAPSASAAVLSKKRASSNKPSWVIMIGIVVALLIVAGLYYLWAGSGFSSADASATPTSPQLILAELGKIILLPAGETPTIATVSDLSKLAGQAFFANAKAGDLVIMYAHARRAILYRSSEHKVIEVAPITLDAH